MSEDKIKRRRFLADILFAGGAISAAALLAQATRGPKPEPSVAGSAPSPTPKVTVTPEMMAKGEMALPSPPPKPEVHLKGKVALPQPKKP